jgi:hypothetical protein
MPNLSLCLLRRFAYGRVTLSYKQGYFVALFFLIVVLLLMVALITLFAFPPHRWAEWLNKDTKKK